MVMFVGELKVDYVRVYQDAGTVMSGTQCKHSEKKNRRGGSNAQVILGLSRAV